jgi:hypothetical protein
MRSAGARAPRQRHPGGNDHVERVHAARHEDLDSSVRASKRL